MSALKVLPLDLPRRVNSWGGATPILAKLIKFDSIREFCKLPDPIKEFTHWSNAHPGFSHSYAALFRRIKLINSLLQANWSHIKQHSWKPWKSSSEKVSFRKSCRVLNQLSRLSEQVFHWNYMLCLRYKSMYTVYQACTGLCCWILWTSKKYGYYLSYSICLLGFYALFRYRVMTPHLFFHVNYPTTLTPTLISQNTM